MSDSALAEALALKAKKALTLVDRNARILEIGPSYSPIAPKSAGWNAFSVDHASQAALQAKYAGVSFLDASKIEPVDFVWTDGLLSEAVPQEHHGTFDACVASHVLEHVPNPISFLSEISKLLKPDGVLSLILPDKRYEMDHFRPATSAGAWLDAFDRNAVRHSRGTLYDFHAYAVLNDGSPFWGPSSPDKYEFYKPFEDISKVDEASTSDAYVDTHVWVFTPSSFKLIMLEMNALGLLNLTCEAEPSPSGCEFYLSYRKSSGPALEKGSIAKQRFHLLNDALLESADSRPPQPRTGGPSTALRSWQHRAREFLRSCVKG